MSQIDVLLLTDNSLDTIGGAEESTKIIINGLKKDFILGVIQPGEIKDLQSSVHYFPLSRETRLKTIFKNPIKFIKYIWNVRKVIVKNKPRLIHTQAQVSFFIIGLLRKLKLIPKSTKFIHTERGLYTKYNTFFKRLFIFFMKELNTLVTTTEFNMEHWKQALKGKGYPKNFTIIENTAGELFETYDSSRKKKDDDKFVLGFAGRYSKQKNWPLAVEISEKLKEEIGDNLVVKMAVGCLDDLSLKATKEMFNYMSNLLGENFEGQINISLEEMDQFYYELDAFILTSNHNTESFGRTLVEAMNRKVVVLSTDAGGPEEIVRNKSSICSTSGEFVEKIFVHYYNKELMEKEKELNFKSVKQRYSLKKNISKHLDLYNKLST